MADEQKVDDPLRGLFRQLGIPLSGEGEFADVKPNTEIRPWPGPFDRIREAFDPEYAKAKHLATTQQGMLQDFISSAQAFKALQATQIPTVGEAQALYPGFPVPPQAMKTTPQAPLQSGEMPVLQGTQQAQVPSRMQGPMPGVLTPLGESAVKWFGASNEVPLNKADMQSFAERGPEFYQEAPRPMRTIEIGQYGPDMAPSQSTVMDPTTKLPPSFQAQLGALQHQTAQRQVQPRTTTEADITLANQMRLEQIIKTGQESYPGERQLLENRLALFNKTSRPETPEGRKIAAEATQQEAQAGVAVPKAQAEVRDIQNRAAHTAAQTNEINTLLEPKLKELLSRIDLHKAQGNVLAGKAELAQFREQLGIDNLKWKVIHTLMLTDELDSASKLEGIKSVLASDPNLQVSASDPSFLGKLFGQTQGSGIKIEPRQGATPQAGIPKIVPTPVLPQQEQPQTPVQPPVQDDMSALKSLGQSMKDGEIKEYKGQKYRRKGGKLEKVQ